MVYWCKTVNVLWRVCPPFTMSRFVYLSFVFLHCVAASMGQVDDFLQSDYDYGSLPRRPPSDADDILRQHIRIKSPKEQKFLEGLIIEAGRHVLFPESYTVQEPHVTSQPIDDVRGQPEVVETYMDRRTLRSPDCPEDCPYYKPVCGSDGRVYESECHLVRAHCGKRDVSVEDWTKCRGKHYLCPLECLEVSDPVCGPDGRIYHNMCALRKKYCGELLDPKPLRSCYSEGPNVGESCPEKCEKIYKPVCGSNGVIYYNECFLKLRTCKEGVAEVDMENCAYLPKCPEVCLALYDPVCGSDGKLYINKCRMLQQNCGKDIKQLDNDRCDFSDKSYRYSSRN